MIEPDERAVMTVLLAAAVAGLIGASFTLSPGARLTPLAVAIPTFLLLCRELALDVGRREVRDVAGTPAVADEQRVFGWLGIMVAAVLAVGVAAGLALFVFLFLRLRAHDRLAVSASVAAGTWLLLEFGVERLLRISLYGGLGGDWVDWR